MADRAYRAAGGREEGDRRRREGRLSGGEVERLRHQDDPRDRAPQEDGKPCSPGSGGSAGDLPAGAGAGAMARHCEPSCVAALLALPPETKAETPRPSPLPRRKSATRLRDNWAEAPTRS